MTEHKEPLGEYLVGWKGSLNSGVARAFPGGQLAHPEGQNEDENK